MEESHVMVDLETAGLLPGSAILSIGAVAFNPYKKEIENSFYTNVNMQDGFEHGLRIEALAMKWWASEELKAARELLRDARLPLKNALQLFSRFYGTDPGRIIWSNADFDMPLLYVAMDKTGVPMPWHYHSARDVRTLFSLVPWSFLNAIKPKVEHFALDDAICQAKQVQAAIKALNNKYLVKKVYSKNNS